MRVKSIIATLVLVSASIAQAEYVPFDVEPNNNIPSANALVSDIGVVNFRFATCSRAAELGIGSLAAGGGDVDYYTVALPAGCHLTAITTPSDVVFVSPDTTMQILDNLGNELAWNDDAGFDNTGNPTRGSALRIETPYTGIYYIAVSGYADGVLNATPMDGIDDLSGAPHVEQGEYGLTLSVYPEPSSLALIGLGALALLRRRK